MALKRNFGGDGSFIKGDDKVMELEVLQGPLTSEMSIDGSTIGTPIDVSGWDVRWFIRLKSNSSGSSIITRTPLTDGVQATVVGTFNAIRGLNTQRLRITLTFAETNLLTNVMAQYKDNSYAFSWKRMTSGSETVLRFGDAIVEETAARI